MKEQKLDFKNYRFVNSRRCTSTQHLTEKHVIQFIPSEVFNNMLKIKTPKKGKFVTVAGNAYDVLDNRTGEGFYKRFDKMSDALEWLNYGVS